jgi:excisionase family DNA binding protein
VCPGQDAGRPSFSCRCAVFLTINECAALLRVTPAAIRSRIQRGTLAGVCRVGRSIRVDRAALLASMVVGCVVKRDTVYQMIREIAANEMRKREDLRGAPWVIPSSIT